MDYNTVKELPADLGMTVCSQKLTLTLTLTLTPSPSPSPSPNPGANLGAIEQREAPSPQLSAHALACSL